jgi:hypothetical protein
MKKQHREKGNILPLLGWVLAALVAVMIAAPIAFAAGSGETQGFEPVVLSDDIFKTTTDVERDRDAMAAEAEADAGKDNNGNGNNDDGVDSSNPNQGGGGPNADGMDSDSTVDDESTKSGGSKK